MQRTERRRQELEAHMADAVQALRRGDLAVARSLGRHLCDAGFSGGYEILAGVERARGREDRAISLLEEGVTRAPGVWPLWEQLGNHYSDAGRDAEALEAYERALGCHGVNRASVLFNVAVVFERRGEFRRALELLEEFPPERSVAGATALRVSLLRALGRNPEAIELASAALESCPVRAGPGSRRAYREHVELHALLAAALLDEDHDRAEALRHAQACVEHGGTHPEALWVLRELTGTRSPRARRYTITVRGRWGERDFLRAFRVLADSEREALELARQFEPPDVRPTVELDTIEAVVPNRDPEAPRGVYHASLHVFAE